MNILEVFKQLAKKSARSHVSRSRANRAHLYLEALETRMAPSSITGGDLTSPVTNTSGISRTGS